MSLRTVTTLLATGTLLLSTASHAVIGAVDNVPAATLLLPYFEISPTQNIASQLPASQPETDNTVAQLRNASSAPVLARVTVWTDYGVPTLGFDVYLNGNDSQDIDLRLLFAGVLPVTGTGISRPNNVSGANPPPFPGCAARLNTARLDATTLTNLRTAHTGLPSAAFGNQCAGSAYGDGLARGYLTIDAVNQCSAAGVNPTAANYFIAGGQGVASNQNVLFGDYTVARTAENYAYGDRLISLEADAANPLTSQNNRYTFYAGLVGYSARDNRESLATNWGVRFAQSTGSNIRTDLIVWRDVRSVVTPACSSVPAPWNQPAREIGFFDDRTAASRLDPTRTVLGLATQRLPMNPTATLPASGPYRNFYVPYNFGWTRLNLNDASVQAGAPTGWIARQAWVVTTEQQLGRYLSGQSATAMDAAVQPQSNFVFPGVPIVPSSSAPASVEDVAGGAP